MMIFILTVLTMVCIGQLFYLIRIRKQGLQWLNALKEIKENPHQKMFIKGKGMFAEINFELNGILEKNQVQLLQLEKADVANRRILTNISHDIRTPLASLIGYLEALSNHTADDAKEYIQISYTKALALESLITMLFEWCKINSKEQQYVMECYDINELTREIIIDWLPILDQKKICFTVNISEEECFLRMDKTAYKRVIDNLLQNAVYHGLCSHITIQIQKNKDKIAIVVWNNGAAIPKDKLPYIFDRLFQCDSARTKTGTGLGLTITKELITSMKGSIDVSSTPESGTAFTIIFRCM